MPSCNISAHIIRGKSYAELVILNFFNASDLHKYLYLISDHLWPDAPHRQIMYNETNVPLITILDIIYAFAGGSYYLQRAHDVAYLLDDLRYMISGQLIT